MTRKIKLKISARLLKKKFRQQGFRARKHCRFCGSQDRARSLDYKNIELLRGFLTERNKILPSRISGNCSLHQRDMAQMIRKSRTMALLPYTPVRRG